MAGVWVPSYVGELTVRVSTTYIIITKNHIVENGAYASDLLPILAAL